MNCFDGHINAIAYLYKKKGKKETRWREGVGQLRSKTKNMYIVKKYKYENIQKLKILIYSIKN